MILSLVPCIYIHTFLYMYILSVPLSLHTSEVTPCGHILLRLHPLTSTDSLSISTLSPPRPLYVSVVTPCAHVFCRACILQLVHHEKHSTSPPSPSSAVSTAQTNAHRVPSRKGALQHASSRGGVTWRGGVTSRCPTCRAPFAAGDVRVVPRKSRFLLDVRTNWRSSAKTR